MTFGEYCKVLHGITEAQLARFFMSSQDYSLQSVEIQDLILLSDITKMSVPEHAEEIVSLLREQTTLTASA